MDRTYAHFIGVGGAGMSGLALVLHDRGFRVTGSDLKDSKALRALADAGVTVSVGHDASHVGDPEIVVVSTAIPEHNPELAAARERGLEIWPRARMLAHLAGGRSTIAVAGTHGKTTTSSMVATMLFAMGSDPTFLIGGEVAGFDANARSGAGSHYVVEADESDGSFVYLEPEVALITNIEADHLDHYETLAQIEDAFVEFMSRTTASGTVVACADDARLLELARECGRTMLTYGFSAGADVRCFDAVHGETGYRFRIEVDGVEVQCETVTPGLHMVANATGAVAVAVALGMDPALAAAGVSSFEGVRRRFDHIGTERGVTVVDDYAHHPTEVDATLNAASGLGYRRVWAVFQPHRYSRTEKLAPDFGRAFTSADHVVLMDVYSAGETPIPGVSGKTLVREVLAHAPRSSVTYLPHRTQVADYLEQRLGVGDLVLTMGAGDVTTLGAEILSVLRPATSTE